MDANKARNEREAHAQLVASCMIARRVERLREVEEAFRITPLNVAVGIVVVLFAALAGFF